ncbi:MULTISPECIES: hypothetical protein [Dyadobacter]|uniref:hypothetical protein n=1 Tax=Dyadobacter TaxID=120831 RepID=UPI001E5971C3|nr:MULTISPECIES: hypothetical protein [Dyadobacter]
MKKGGVDYENKKLIFKSLTFDFDKATEGFELAIETEAPNLNTRASLAAEKPKL